MPVNNMPDDNMNNGMDNKMGGNMDNDMNMPDEFDDNMKDENPYDSDFDAGVEADEEEDPKKYIEQLSGKLSQSLNSYQDGLPKPDAETAKYAAGMVIKAAIKGLSDDDVKDILDKLKDNEPDEETDNNEQESDFEPDNDDFDEEQNDDEGVSESKKYNIDEIFQDITKDDEDEEFLDKPIKNITFSQKPFTAPKF